MFTQEQIEKIKAGCDRDTPIKEIVSVASGKAYLRFVDEQVEKEWPFEGVSYPDVFGMDTTAIIKTYLESAGINNFPCHDYDHVSFDVTEPRLVVDNQYLTSYLNEKFPATKGYTYQMFCTWRGKEREKAQRILHAHVKEIFGPDFRRAKTSDE